MNSSCQPLRRLNNAVCILCVLLLSAPVFATTVLALIDKKHHKVVLAGDSLLNYKLAKTSAATCKTYARPGCSYGMAGLFSKEYPAFQLKDLADQACELNGDLLHRADAFLEIAREPVAAVAQYIRQNEPQFYADLLNGNGGEFVIVIFAGTQDGHSAIFARGYKLDPNGGVKPLSVNVTEDKSGVGFFAGSNQAIAAYVKANPKWQKMDKVAAARKFVQLEIDAHPQWVGPPISVLTVNDLDQEKWISKGVCDLPPAPVVPPSEEPATQPAPSSTPPPAQRETPPATPPAPPPDPGW